MLILLQTELFKESFLLICKNILFPFLTTANLYLVSFSKYYFQIDEQLFKVLFIWGF